MFVNEITDSHSFGFGILNGINKLVFHERLQESVIIFMMTALSLFYLAFIRNAVIVGRNRYFLERRRFHNTRPDRVLFVPRLGYTKHVALVMTEMYFKQILWSFTIIMGPVKFYEYRMIPYILAENPSVTPKEAFAHSKEMMRGEKWYTFLLDLSFLPFVAAGALTFNLSNIFYFDPYRECVNAELYMALREQLFVRAHAAELIDITEEDHQAAEVTEEALHIRNVFHDRGLDLPAPVDDEYPEEDYPFPLKESRQWLTIDYRKNYSISTYFLFFYTFSIIGWIWEVGLHLISDGTFVNRGTLFGPWLPIYGFGGLLILIILKPLRDKPFRMFLGSFALCGVLEYTTAWALEAVYHQKWWDYTGYFCNLQGRICLEGLIAFGLGGVGFTYFMAPVLDNLYKILKPITRRILCIGLSILFLVDCIHSAIHPNTGDGVTTVTDKGE